MNTPRLVPLVGVVAAMSACAASASAALTQWMSHTFELSIQPSASSGLAPQPNVRFYGMSLVSLSEIPDPAGVMNNPLYKDKGLKGNNPLYKGMQRFRSPGTPFDVADIESIEMTFADVQHLHQEKIVHRDLAARNVLLRTSRGDYLPALNFQLNFSSDGPLDYRTATNELPIRWNAPESLRLFLNGDETSSDWLDIGPGASFETYAIPSPAAASLVALASLAVARRRR